PGHAAERHSHGDHRRRADAWRQGHHPDAGLRPRRARVPGGHRHPPTERRHPLLPQLNRPTSPRVPLPPPPTPAPPPPPPLARCPLRAPLPVGGSDSRSPPLCCPCPRRPSLCCLWPRHPSLCWL